MHCDIRGIMIGLSLIVIVSVIVIIWMMINPSLCNVNR